MKYIIYIVLYMFISGLFNGAVHNTYHKECKTKGTPNTYNALSSLLWPVHLGTFATLDLKYYENQNCDVEKNG